MSDRALRQPSKMTIILTANARHQKIVVGYGVFVERKVGAYQIASVWKSAIPDRHPSAQFGKQVAGMKWNTLRSRSKTEMDKLSWQGWTDCPKPVATNLKSLILW